MRLPRSTLLVQLEYVVITPCKGLSFVGATSLGGHFSSPWQGKQTWQACDGCLPGWRTTSFRWTLTWHERLPRSDVLFLHKTPCEEIAHQILEKWLDIEYSDKAYTYSLVEQSPTYRMWTAYMQKCRILANKRLPKLMKNWDLIAKI